MSARWQKQPSGLSELTPYEGDIDELTESDAKYFAERYQLTLSVAGKNIKRGLSREAKMSANCRHNRRRRSTAGFYCEDCHTFFGVDTPTYRRDELLTTMWMVVHNIDAAEQQRTYGTDDFHGVPEARAMADKIGIGVKHENYEELIAEAEAIAAKYGKNRHSADVVLR